MKRLILLATICVTLTGCTSDPTCSFEDQQMWKEIGARQGYECAYGARGGSYEASCQRLLGRTYSGRQDSCPYTGELWDEMDLACMRGKGPDPDACRWRRMLSEAMADLKPPGYSHHAEVGDEVQP